MDSPIEHFTTRGLRRPVLLSLAVLLASSAAIAAGGAEIPTNATVTVPYEVRFAGVSDGHLLQLLEDTSRLKALKDRPPASLFALSRRAEEDKPRLLAVLRSEGYFDSQVDVPPLAATTRPVPVVVEITLGPRFTIETVDFDPTDEGAAEALNPVAASDLGLGAGTPARSARVVEGEDRLVALLRRNGYPFAKVTDRRVVVDHETASMHVTFNISAGPAARFGPIAVSGLAQVETSFVTRLAPWTKSDRYDAAKLADYRDALRKSGLFSSVRVEPASSVSDDGSLPIDVTVSEADHRYVGFGANFSTSEGPGGRVFWGTRNLRGSGEKLEISASASAIAIGSQGKFTVPHFFDKSQSFQLSLETARETTDAFDSDNIDLVAKVERPIFIDNLVATAGISFAHERVERIDADLRIFNLVGLPLGLRYDTTENLLDPSDGWRGALSLTPYTGPRVSFTTLRLDASVYRPLGDRVIAAGWASAGSIFGEDFFDIPPPQRFYSGGGGSVRGYAFQLVGPVDRRLTPLGGRSLSEVGAELRFGVFEDFGVAAFVEGGNVFGSTLPNPTEKLLWGAGTGLRYHTPVGPVRLDVAVPLDRREGVDDAFQIYLSLGQAF